MKSTIPTLPLEVQAQILDCLLEPYHDAYENPVHLPPTNQHSSTGGIIATLLFLLLGLLRRIHALWTDSFTPPPPERKTPIDGAALMSTRRDLYLEGRRLLTQRRRFRFTDPARALAFGHRFATTPWPTTQPHFPCGIRDVEFCVDMMSDLRAWADFFAHRYGAVFLAVRRLEITFREIRVPGSAVLWADECVGFFGEVYEALVRNVRAEEVVISGLVKWKVAREMVRVMTGKGEVDEVEEEEDEDEGDEEEDEDEEVVRFW